MLWIKALHIIAVISWFAGLLYLPRLFVYHAASEDAVSRERFTLMERRLYRLIMGPAMAASILLGLALLGWFRIYGWLAVKLILVVALVAFHIWCGRQIRNLAANGGLRPATYRLCNEIPTVLLIAIVLLVVLKPF